MLFKKLVDMKNDKVKFDIIPKTNEEYISVIHGCVKFNISYRFSSRNLGELDKNLNEDDFKISKKEVLDKRQNLNKY